MGADNSATLAETLMNSAVSRGVRNAYIIDAVRRQTAITPGTPESANGDIMAKSATARKSAPAIRARDAGKPESMIATLLTLDAVITFALRHVNAENVAALINVIRATFASYGANRNVGRTTGWRVMQFQNVLVERCAKMNPRPTLVQLVFIGASEFPNAAGTIFAPRNPVNGELNIRAAVTCFRGMVENQINRGTHGQNGIVPAGAPFTFDPGIDIRTRRTVAPAVPVAPATPAKSAGRLVRKSA